MAVRARFGRLCRVNQQDRRRLLRLVRAASSSAAHAGGTRRAQQQYATDLSRWQKLLMKPRASSRTRLSAGGYAAPMACAHSAA